MIKYLVCKKEEIKYNNKIKQHKMLNSDYITTEYIKERNLNCVEIPDHLYRILIVRGTGSGKTNALFNLINHKPDIDKFF